jgi:hypothetical protein
MIESIAKLTDSVKMLTEKLDKQTKKATRLKARLMTWMQSSPASERGAANQQTLVLAVLLHVPNELLMLMMQKMHHLPNKSNPLLNL